MLGSGIVSLFTARPLKYQRIFPIRIEHLADLLSGTLKDFTFFGPAAVYG